MNPLIHAKLLAIKRRLLIRFGRGFDPYPVPPEGIELSPSIGHFNDYELAPLALSWTQHSKGDVLDWQKPARAKLAELCGYTRQANATATSSPKQCDINSELQHRQFYLRLRGGSGIPVSILRRADTMEALPVMICLQGTNSGAHLSWGEARMPADPIKIAAGADYARQAVAQGYAAVCIEQTAFGERRETLLPQASRDPCIDTAGHALLLGRTLLGERASDVSSVIDWLETESSTLSLDTTRIEIMGSSSGGSTAIIAAALDDRIGSVLASGCVGFIRDTIAKRGNASGQNIIPGILNWLEFDDIVGLIAPRPFLVVSGETDHIWPHAGAQRVIDNARHIYEAHNAGRAVEAVPAPGGHRFYPDIAWRHYNRLIDHSRSHA